MSREKDMREKSEKGERRQKDKSDAGQPGDAQVTTYIPSELSTIPAITRFSFYNPDRGEHCY